MRDDDPIGRLAQDLATMTGRSATSEQVVARAVAKVIGGHPSLPAALATAEARDLIYRLAWLLALRAPALRHQALVTGIAQAEWIANGERTWAETLEHHRQLERIAGVAGFVGHPDLKRLDTSLERAHGLQGDRLRAAFEAAMGMVARNEAASAEAVAAVAGEVAAELERQVDHRAADPSPAAGVAQRHQEGPERTRLVFAAVVRRPTFAAIGARLGWRFIREVDYQQSQESQWLPGAGSLAGPADPVDGMLLQAMPGAVLLSGGADTGATPVTFVDDNLIGLQYLVMNAPSAEVASLRQQVEEQAPLYSRESVRGLLSEGAGYDPILALYIAALIAPSSAEPETLGWFQRAVGSDHEDVRCAAYFAMTYPGWPEFEPLLVAAREGDPAATGRQSAERVLDSLRRNAWSA